MFKKFLRNLSISSYHFCFDLISEPNSFDSEVWISDIRNHADAKNSIIHYKRITKIIKQIIYLIATVFLLLGLFLPWKRSRTIAKDSICTALTTHLLTYSTEVSTYIGSTMNKYRTISIFLENMNDDPELIRCSDKLMPQLVKFVTSVTNNIQPKPCKFFVAQLHPLDEKRICQFEFDPSNSNFKLYYMFETDNDTVQLRSYDNSVNFENWDPFHQGTLESNTPTSFFNLSLFGTQTFWSYHYISFGNKTYFNVPQMTVFTPSSNSNGELFSISGISFFAKDIATMIERIPCDIINSSSLSSSSNSLSSDDNQSSFVKYALLIAKENRVIIEKNIGVVEPLEIKGIEPIFPTLDQLNLPFWSKLNQVVFNHKDNEVFEFKFESVSYLVVHTGVSTFKSSIMQQKHDFNNLGDSGIINKIINSAETGNETHTFIACFPIGPSIQNIYYPMSVVFVLGVSLIFVTFFVALFLINRENLWRIRKIALQTPNFKHGSNNEYFSFHQAPNGEHTDQNNIICPYLGYIPHSIVNIRNFQLEYPDDATLNKALDNAVENLTLREDQKYSLMKKDTCDFCKYFLPEKIDFQKDLVTINTKKSGRLSRRLTSLSHRRSSFTESEESAINDDDSDNDDNDYYSPKINLNANVEDETDTFLYKIWKTKSFPSIQVMSKKKQDENDTNQNFHNTRKSKGTKNKFIWAKFQIDQFISEPYRMLMRYMMTLLNDCQLLFPPFDPMCIANLLISIEKGIKNPVHAAHELFSVHQVIYGPFNYWITNKLDILVLFFTVYFSHFDYRLYSISKNQENAIREEYKEANQKRNANDDDSTSLSDSLPKTEFNNTNENDFEITMEGFKAFDDDFSKIEENLKELKKLLFQIFPIRASSSSKPDYEDTYQRNESGLLYSLNSYYSDIPDSQSISNSNQNTNINDNSTSKTQSKGKGKTHNKKTSSNPPAFQNLKKFTLNKRSYSNIISQDTNPKSLVAATTESETDNTETQTTETMTSLSLSVGGFDGDSNFDVSLTSDVKNKLELSKKKKNKGPFWYFWKTLKQLLFKVCMKNELFDLLGSICVRIQSPYLDIHNDYGDKIYFMVSILKLCETCAYWSPLEIMEKALEVEDPITFTNEETNDRYFISSFHLEYCQKIAMPWIKILALFKPQAFEDVIKNSLATIDYWKRKKEDSLDSQTERDNLNNITDVKLIDDNNEKDISYENDRTNNSSDDNEYNYHDND